MKKHWNYSKKILSCILMAAILFMMMPSTVLAEEISLITNEISGCHPIHDENCGYKEATVGAPCTHLTKEGTYSCLAAHSFDEYVCSHHDDCGYATYVEGTLCTHECDTCQSKHSRKLEQTAQDVNEKVSFQQVSLENIYLSKSGSDGNDGSSPQKAVKTFAKAFELVEAGGTIWLSGSGVIEISDEQTWGTADKSGVTVKRTATTSAGAMFIIKANGKVTMRNITFDGTIRDIDGNALPNASGQVAFMVFGTLIMDSGSVIENNYSAANGGAVSVNGTLSLQGNASIRNNKTMPGKGGGVYGATNSTITVNDIASITGNNGGFGGGIYSLGKVVIRGGTISNNTATVNGGGIDSSAGSLLMSEGTISNNKAGENGGGIYCGGSSSKISGVVIENNHAGKYGGGIYYSNVTTSTDGFSIGEGTLKGNLADGINLPAWGKGNNVYVYDNHLLVEGNALSNGGVFLYLNDVASKLIFNRTPESVSLEGIKVGNAKPMADTVVAEGKDYTFTLDDLSKFTYEEEGYTFQLDSDKNQIKMCELYSVSFDVDGEDDKYPTQKIISSNKAIKPKDPEKTGYTFEGWYVGNTLFDFANTPITANITLKAKWTDKTSPLAEISLGEKSWNQFLNTITFATFFKDTQSVKIVTSDAGSGVNTVEYYIANAKLEDISTITWTPYTNDISLQPNHKYVIYARVSDKAGNVSIINSDGFVIDDIAPTITGADSNGVYCISRELTILDDDLDTVTIDGEKVTVTDGKITVGSKPAAQTIVATDKSGNLATITMTVNASHMSNSDDDDCTTAIHCFICNEITMEAKVHEFTGAWETDGSYHWQTCKHKGCTQIKDKAAHTFQTDDGDCTTAIYCTICDHIITAEKTHTLSDWKTDGTSHWKECEHTGCTQVKQMANHTFGDWVIDKAAMETEIGSMYRLCSVCGYREALMIPTLPHTHTSSTEWSKDTNTHWQSCMANDGERMNEAAHTWSITEHSTLATNAQEGVKIYTCTICSQTKTEVISKLPFLSSIVDKSTGIMLEYEDGSTMDSNIVLIVTSKPQAELDKFSAFINEAAMGLTLGELYDVKLLKDGVAIQPDGKIKVSIPLTDKLNAMTDLQVVYIDDTGNVTIISSQIIDGKIMFVTDHLSYYGVIGKEKSTVSQDDHSTHGNTNSPQTNDNTKTLLNLLMMCASGTMLVALGKKRKVCRHLKK